MDVEDLFSDSFDESNLVTVSPKDIFDSKRPEKETENGSQHRRPKSTKIINILSSVTLKPPSEKCHSESQVSCGKSPKQQKIYIGSNTPMEQKELGSSFIDLSMESSSDLLSKSSKIMDLSDISSEDSNFSLNELNKPVKDETELDQQKEGTAYEQVSKEPERSNVSPKQENLFIDHNNAMAHNELGFIDLMEDSCSNNLFRKTSKILDASDISSDDSNFSLSTKDEAELDQQKEERTHEQILNEPEVSCVSQKQHKVSIGNTSPREHTEIEDVFTDLKKGSCSSNVLCETSKILNANNISSDDNHLASSEMNKSINNRTELDQQKEETTREQILKEPEVSCLSPKQQKLIIGNNSSMAHKELEESYSNDLPCKTNDEAELDQEKEEPASKTSDLLQRTLFENKLEISFSPLKESQSTTQTCSSSQNITDSKIFSESRSIIQKNDEDFSNIPSDKNLNESECSQFCTNFQKSDTQRDSLFIEKSFDNTNNCSLSPECLTIGKLNDTLHLQNAVKTPQNLPLILYKPLNLSFTHLTELEINKEFYSSNQELFKNTWQCKISPIGNAILLQHFKDIIGISTDNEYINITLTNKPMIEDCNMKSLQNSNITFNSDQLNTSNINIREGASIKNEHAEQVLVSEEKYLQYNNITFNSNENDSENAEEIATLERKILEDQLTLVFIQLKGLLKNEENKLPMEKFLEKFKRMKKEGKLIEALEHFGETSKRRKRRRKSECESTSSIKPLAKNPKSKTKNAKITSNTRDKSKISKTEINSKTTKKSNIFETESSVRLRSGSRQLETAKSSNTKSKSKKRGRPRKEPSGDSMSLSGQHEIAKLNNKNNNSKPEKRKIQVAFKPDDKSKILKIGPFTDSFKNGKLNRKDNSKSEQEKTEICSKTDDEYEILNIDKLKNGSFNSEPKKEEQLSSISLLTDILESEPSTESLSLAEEFKIEEVNNPKKDSKPNQPLLIENNPDLSFLQKDPRFEMVFIQEKKRGRKKKSLDSHRKPINTQRSTRQRSMKMNRQAAFKLEQFRIRDKKNMERMQYLSLKECSKIPFIELERDPYIESLCGHELTPSGKNRDFRDLPSSAKRRKVL